MIHNFFTPYKRTLPQLEENHGETIVETSGYVTAEEKILSMLYAGKRLQESRADNYDYQEGENLEEEIDPTRSPNFDLSDAFVMRNQIRSRKADARNRADNAPAPVPGTTPAAPDAPSKTPPGVDTSSPSAS